MAEDSAEAVKWYRKAAEQGLAYAQCKLGLMYKDGIGVAEDSAEAVKWYRKAAEQGLADAQGWLSTMYYNGQGVVKDDVESERWAKLWRGRYSSHCCPL